MGFITSKYPGTHDIGRAILSVVILGAVREAARRGQCDGGRVAGRPRQHAIIPGRGLSLHRSVIGFLRENKLWAASVR